MKQTVLPETPEDARRRMRRLILLCLLTAAGTLCANILLALRFPGKTAVLFVNIVSDTVIGWGTVFLLDRYKPERILLRLSVRNGIVLTCRVLSVSEQSLRYLDLDCREVRTDSRTLFLPCGTICLQAGKCYRLHTVSNLITEAEG